MAAKKAAADEDIGAKFLWGELDRPSRGPKPTLSVERIAQAAIGIADAEGLAAVSMQRVASAFDVTTMALYRYVPGKAELVELMVDTVGADVPDLARVSGGWRARLETWARRCFEMFRQHPWVLEATPARRRLMGPNQLGWLNAALSALAEAGLSGIEQHDAFIVLIGHVRSTAQQARDAGSRDEEWGAAMARLLEKHRDRYPALIAAIASGAFDPSRADVLEFGLRCILDGIEARVAGRAPPRSERTQRPRRSR